MQAKVRMVGARDLHKELASLYAWLTGDPDFRGRVTTIQAPIRPDEMGAVGDVLAVAVASGGTLTVLANSISIWLQQRHSTISVELTDPTGARIKIEPFSSDVSFAVL
jgi:hypothetical protein